MAAGPFTLTNAALLRILNGTTDWVNGNKYAVLVDNTHGVPAETELDLDDATDNGTTECVSADYSPVNLASETIAGNFGEVVYSSSNVSFGSSVTISARYMYIVEGTTGTKAGTDLLIGFVDLNEGGSTNVASSNLLFSITLGANGWFKVA